jgi:hypothetical protein
MRIALACALVFTACAPAADAGQLTFTLIGNEAFHITDGETTLLSDFPYRSGAFGYMEYNPSVLPPIKNGITLITHSHADHWQRQEFEPMDIAIIGPPSVTERLDPERVIPLREDEPMRYRDITVHAVRTPHNLSVEHYSYLVTWHGVTIYFPGDTESPDDLLKQRGIDVMFITPWLIDTLREQGKTVDAGTLVGYHLHADEVAPDFQQCRTMKQGESFTVDFDDASR